MIKNKQKLMIIMSLLICFVLSVSFVSASENVDNTTISTADGQSILQTTEAVKLQQSTDQEVLTAQDDGSFTALNDKINDPNIQEGGTVYLENDYKYVSTDSAFIDGIFIRKNITIDGQGHMINGSNLAKIFAVGSIGNTHKSVSNVILKNINFVNGYSSVADKNTAFAAVEFYGNGTIDHCNFSYNNAYCAAAIAWGDGVNSNITNCIFDHNRGTGTGGGAIRFKTGMVNVNIENSIFKYNYALSFGGAIHSDKNARSDICTIYDCTFINNTAGGGAGAIFFASPNSIINRSRFINNSAGLGGALYWDTQDSLVINSNFTTNNATSGGAIYCKGSSSTVELSRFINNSATDGGAIRWVDTEDGTVKHSTFKGNNATGGNGGALYLENIKNGNVYNTTFDNGRAVNGSGMYVTGTFCEVTYTNFTNDVASYGGSIYLEVGAHINHCLFNGENATYDGGAVYLNTINANAMTQLASYADRLGVFNSTISNCYAGRDGGAGYVRVSYGVVRNTTFVNNYAGHDGGAGYVYGSNGKLINSTFIGNNATNGNGGAVYWYGINGTAYDVRIYNNTAVNGGGIYLSKPGNIAITGGYSMVNLSDFSNNNASGSGGSIYCGGMFSNILSSNFTYDKAVNGSGIYLNVGAYIYNCSFFKENATYDGGAIYLKANNTGISQEFIARLGDRIGVVSTNITNCSAGHDGGAGYVVGNGGIVHDTHMINCSAGHDGGAGYVSGDYGRLYNSTMLNNIAGNEGGALFWEGDGGHVDNVKCDNNFADDNGGSIYILGSDISINKSNFTATNATNYGGSIYIAGNYVNINESRFERCAANNYHGGAIYITGLNITIKKSNFTMNKVDLTSARGGSIDVLGDNTTIVECIFDRCSAYEGGVVYVNGTGIRLINTSCNRSLATNGGAFYVSGNNATLYNVTVSNNNATNYGGAVYVSGNFTNITISNFTRCIANNFHGGAIYIIGLNTNISKTHFKMNNATNRINSGRGGSIDVQGNGTNILDCTFIQCSAYEGGVLYVNGTGIRIDNCTSEMSSANDGGAVYIMGNNVSVNKFNISKSNATGSGGAMYVAGDCNNITYSNFNINVAAGRPGITHNGGSIFISGLNTTIAHSTFNTTVAPLGSGGSIYVEGNYANISYSNFTNCFASSAGESGGAIYISGHNVTVEHSKFNITNAAGGYGGAIYIEGDNATVNDSSFVNVFATLGGVIYIYGDYSNIINSNISNSYALNDGGALYIFGDNATVSVEFENCSALGRYTSTEGPYVASSYGGAIYLWGSNSNVTGSSFTNCTVKNTGYGGAIYIAGENNRVELSSFHSNEEGDCYGGDIYVYGDDADIISSTFSRSKAIEGGSIYVEGHYAHVHNSTFTICRATENGGAIYIQGNHSTIDNSTIKESYSQINGGGIYIHGSNNTVSNSSFLRNDRLGTTIVHNGSSIYVEGEGVKILNSTFNHTSSSENGGAVYIHGDNAVINDSGFYQSAGVYGGALYIEGDNAAMNNLTFDSNNATEDGSALYVAGQFCKLFNSTFTNNIAYDDSSVYWRGDNGTIYNITCFNSKGLGLNNNHAKGGSLSVIGNSTSVDKSHFTQSYASNEAGAVYITGNGVNVTNSVFYNCSITDENGGAMYILGNRTNVVNCSFEMSNATNGGAIYVLGNNVAISGSNITNSNASTSGGAIYIQGVYANITGCSFNLTNAFGHSNDGGGAIFVKGDYASVSKSNFTYTRANFNNRAIGGAIYITGNGVNVTGSNFNNTGSNLYGGAIYIAGENTRIKESNFTNCTVNNGYGGAIYGIGDNATISESIFKICVAEKNGGAIYISSDYADLIGNTFINNTAKSGGGGAVIFSDNAINGTVNYCIFENNIAGTSGGAIFWFGSNYGKLFNSNFTNNSAGKKNGDGGAVYWGNSNYGHIDNCRFIDNVAYFNTDDTAGQGGAIYWYGIDGVIENSYFKGNNASTIIDRRGGGAIALLWVTTSQVGAKNTIITNSIFEDNYSPHGGVICSERMDTLTIIDSHFYHNHASGGGVIFLENGININITGSTFDSNYAVSHGGVIFLNKEGNINITFDNCNFTNNSARYGGVIRMQGTSNITFIHCLFKDNNASNAIEVNDGGAISSDGVVKNITLIDDKFINCRADNKNSDGGAISLSAINSRLENLTFVNCYAFRNGGSLYLYNVKSTIFKNITCYNSSANAGGSIYIQSSTPVFANATIFNSSANNGGAIYISGSNSITNPSILANISVNGSHANVYGGALYASTYVKATNINSTNTYAKQGGSIHWAGNAGVLDGVNILNSHTTGWSGGAISWDNANGKIYNANISDAYSPNHGGAIYWNGNSGTIINMTINNSRSTKDGGAIYWSNKNYGTVVNLTINNTSSNHDGGAIYLYSSSYINFVNVTMDNTQAINGGAIYIYGDNSNTQAINNNFTNFNISNSKASGNGGAICIYGSNNNVAYASNNTFTNFTIKDSSAVLGGAAYIYARQVKNAQNITFINGTFERCNATNYGGALYWRASGGNIFNVTFFNNTASLGGAIYVETYSLTINLSYFNYNIAGSGSAIYTTVGLTIKDTQLFMNRANSDKLLIDIDSSDSSKYKVTITFTGFDNLLNAILARGNVQIDVDNVDYWSAYGQNNTGSRTLTQSDQSFLEAGQNITIEVYDENNKKIYFGNDVLTGLYGNITIAVPSVSSSNSLSSSRKPGLLGVSNEVDGISVKAFLTNEDYYTLIENSKGKDLSHIDASADNINYHQNTTINVNVTLGVTGKVSVYINGTFYDNITLSGSEGSLVNVSNLKWDKYLPAGNYTLFAQYWGDDDYLPSNVTSTFEVKKITPDIIFNITDKGYDLYINLTVKADDLLDSTGNVTLEVDGRTFNVTIVNGTGSVIVKDVTEGNYTIQADYSGDSNYYKNVNSTEFKMKKKFPASIDLYVHDIMINETESINVTVNVNGTGEVIIYVNGKPYTVALNESKAQLNVTGLPKGTNYVLVIYDGDKNLTGGRVEGTFIVSKYEPTININTTNITAGSVEKLNITLPEDAEGIIKVDINGTKYYGEIENGEVIINVKDLKVGVYNVTVYFFEDGKYLSGKNSTLFKVSQAIPIINVTVDNVTYGNQTIVKVVLPDDANGTITININDTYKLENVEIVNGTYTWTVPKILASDNYTATVTYSGNAKYAGSNNSTDFEVYQATPVITIEAVEVDANTNATVIVHITSGTTGNINITVNGKNYSGPIEDGIARITVDKLDVEKYDIVANYAGDKNFTKASTKLEDGLTVVKVSDYLINVTAGDIKVDDLTDIAVNVPGDASGKVIVNINGTNYTATINSGKSVFNNDTGLGEGRYNITAYFGNGKYANKTATGVFYITKRETPIDVSVDPIKVGDKAVITVTAPKDILNNVSIEIDGVKYNKTVDSATGVAVFEVQIWSNGTRTVVATYEGDRKYMFNSTTAQFDVTKRASELNVTATSNTVGGNATVTVKVQDNATGYVSVDVNGTNYTIKLNSTGAGSVNITGLGNGTYYVHATYLGDRQYETSTNNTETFVISKIVPTITVVADTVVYGNHSVIVVSIPGATGNVTIRVNDSAEQEFTLVNGKVEFDAGILAVDNYTVYVSYKGDDKYSASVADKGFNVTQATPVITIEAVEVDANTNAAVVVHITPGTTGDINITVNGKDYSGPIDNGVARIVIDKLPVDTYDIVANYTGDKNFTNASTKLEDGLTVVKVSDYLINVTTGDIKVDDLTNITVNVPGDAGGKVIVNINGTNYTAVISQGKAIFNNDTGLGEGKYNITAYFGDGKYANKTATGVFYITKHTTPISIYVNPIKVGDKAFIAVTAPSDILNNISIEIDGVKYNKSVDSDGMATFEVQIWSNGTRTVVATYDGDRKYVFNSTTAQFDVTKRASELNVTASGNTVGGNATISVKVQDNATGYVSVDVNGTNYTIKLNSTGAGSVNITGLGNGTYYVHATYLGDRQYETSINNTETFIISKNDPAITIIVDTVVYGNHSVVVVSIPGATGNVTIRVNDSAEQEFTLVNGKVEFDAGILAVDNYTAYVSYKGDDKYSALTADKDFNVTQATPVITIEEISADANSNATVIVHITPGTTGDISITVNGKNYLGSIDNGIARIVIDKLDVNTYNITANYTGDKNFTKASAKLVDGLTVTKVSDYLINITAGDIKVGNLTDITVKVPGDASGKVVVNINGTNYTATISQGKAIFNNQTGLGEGKYNITAYFGDDKYANKTVTGVFYITKVETPISIDVNDTLVGDVTKVVVTVPGDVDKNVTIEINGKSYTNRTVNGNATFYLKGLAYGNKTVTATYVGDKKYMFNSTTANFTVDKRKSQVNVTVNATTVGNEVQINVTIPANATGYVIVNVNGTDYTVNTTNGNGTLMIKDLTGGHYNVNLTYIGDEQYFSSTNATSFDVSKVASDVAVSVDNITVGEKAIINIKVPGDATGNVTTVIVGSEAYHVSVSNGTGILVVSGLDVGNYTVKVIYNGDGKYLESSENETLFSVNKINVTETDIKVIDQGNGTVVVVVPGNATGTVNITVEGQNYTANVTNGTAVITLTNVTPGSHNITVIYSGDETHTNATVNATVNISKLTPTVKVDVEDIYVGNVALINVTIPANATGTVTIEINGKSYEAYEFTDGIARFAVGDLAFGNKTVAVRYSGDANYTGINVTANFTVKKRTSQVNVTANATVVGKDAIINVTIPEDARGYVVVNVDGTNYTINMTTFKGSIAITGLGNGTHNVNVTYIGDDKYLSSTNATTFNINKVASDVAVSADNITVGEKAIINIKVPTDATGNVTTVIVGDKTYYVSVSNGTGILVVSGLDVGNYTVKVIYNGDGKYLESSENETLFSVNKINVTETDIKVIDQGNGTVVVVVPGNATGTVNITVEGQNYTANVTNGTAVITLTNVTPGEHNITVIYSGDENHTSITINGNVTLPKYLTPISASVESIKVGDTAIVVINLPENATGMVIIEIDGKSYNTTEIADGIATISVEGLAYGNKTVAVKYVGDANYTANSTTAMFAVDKRISSVNATINPINVGQDATITVEVPDNATGYVIIDINNESYAIKVNNGAGAATIKGLANGTHYINVTYLGDSQYFPSNNTASVVVSKLPSEVSVYVENITVGDKAIITVKVPGDATGNVTTVIVGGKTYYVSVSNGTGILVVPGLEVGNYTVKVIYNGDGKYEISGENKTEFSVNKVNLDETDIKVIDQGNGTVVVVVPGNATGNVTITVEGHNYTANVTNGTAVITLDNVTPGSHNITVIYSGDGNHTNATTDATVNVPKYDTPITVNVAEVTEGETAIITVTVPVDATGNVTVTIDGKQYSGEIKDGEAIVYVDNLTAGDKTVVVEYPGDANYTSNYTISNFTVEKAKTTPEIIVVDQGNGTVVVVVGPNATGNVTITVDGKNFTGDVTNGTAVITLDNVTPGVQNITVIYSGDDNYDNSTVNGTVTVPKYDTPISVNVTEVTEGETAIITVAVPVDATGNVTVTIDGKQYSGEIKDGEAIVYVDNLTAGDKSGIVEYPGDANYTSNYTISNFTVEKANVVPVITVVDQNNGTVVVVVSDNATGNVTVEIDGKNFTGEVINGTAIVTVDNVTPGVQNITVVYSDGVNNVTANGTMTIPKYDTPIKVNVTEITEGETAIITVKVPANATGNVTVTVDGHKYSAEVSNGTATVRVDNLTAGDKSVIVEYDGDDKYASNYTMGNFTVEKAKVTPDIIVIDQGNGTVVVVVGDNATGNVTITVDGQNYTAEVINGTATVTLDNLTPGNNTIEVIYSGDDRHSNATAETVINGPKYDAPIEVNITEIKEGETAVITVTVPENATGEVIISVGGKEYVAVVENGIATVKVDNLTAGGHTIAVEYSGDANYSANYTVSNFTVEKAKATPDITVVDLENGTVVVVVGPNATGNVTITVDGQNYTAYVENGTAIVNLDNVTPGTYDVEVIYSGDDKYNNATREATITITDKQPTKKDTPITVEVKDIYVGETAEIIVNVPENATGNITIEINGISQTQKIVDGRAIFAVDGLAYGNKTVSVIYNGDEKYIHNATTAQFKVSRINSTISVTIEDSQVGENVTVTVYGPSDATGQVLIDIDGVGYYVNLTDGVGTVQVPRMPSGIYDVNITYIGDYKYLSSLNVTKFNVNKVKSFVIPVAHDIYVGELETIRLTVPADATGNVTLVIDGEEYSFNIDTGVLSAAYSEGDKYIVAVNGGSGEIVISGLPKGEYVVSARYNGDAKYLPAENTTTFKVIKIDTDMKVIDQGNGTVVVLLPENATGNVTIKLGNDTYTGKVENGTAVIVLDNATPGKHDIEVTYSGDGDYSSKTVNSTVEIPKYYAPISVAAHDIYVGDVETVTVTLPDGATGKVTIEINGIEYTTDIINGKAEFDVSGLAFGNKTVAVKYSGDDNYRDNYTTGQFEVFKVPSTVKATGKDITVGKNEVITATVPSDATGKVLITIDGINYYGVISNGKAKIIIPELSAGKYTATVTYEGDDKYLPSHTQVKFTVSKLKTPIKADGDEIKQGDEATVVVHVPSDATGTVTINVDGKKYTEEVENGKAVFKVPGLTKGDYGVTAYYSGDKKYEPNDNITDIDVIGDGNRTIPHHDAKNGISLSQYETGNPILILLLILITMGSTQIGRLKK